MNLLKLPDCVLEEILGYLSYDDIAKKRLVSTKVNRICQSLLNRAAVKLLSRLSKEIEKLKPLLPRRKSQRRNHPAEKEIDYLETIEVYVSPLYDKYEEYFDQNLCCFIPGKIIDTSLKLLRRVKYPKSLNNETLDEFKDEICMAEEHFAEHIGPTLQKVQAQREAASIREIQKAKKQRKLKKCQFRDCKYRNTYLGLNRKCNAIKKQFTEEIADLRCRLETMESQKQIATGEHAEEIHLVRKIEVKALRSSKRLAEAKKVMNS